MTALRPGEVDLKDATRSFSVRADNARTLKGALVGKRARGPRPVPALQGVTLHIAPGETVGMVGRNGAGKTSTLRVLAGIIPLESGEARCGGRVVALLELAAGFSRDFSGLENIFLQGALYGFRKAELERRIKAIIAFSELGEFIEAPVKTYSAGMLLRLGFSIAAFLDADVLLIDEVLAVGDEAFQRKCLRRISERIASGTTVVLVSHDSGAIERVCERVVVLDGGRVVFDGPTAEGLLHYHRLMGVEHGRGESLRLGGPGDLEIVDIELRDGSGRSSTIFRGGDPMRVVAVVRARRASSLALELRSLDGVRLFRTSTPVSANATQITFEIADLSLLGGDYDLVLGADEPQRIVHFAVAREPDSSEGLVDLRGTWHAMTETEGALR